ncbi:hypothetical protein PENTCL1PPCAC_10119, partial [Pristionchus entomophagus]
FTMAFFHFVNCLALAFAPYFIVYKYSGLNEYTTVWRIARAVLGFLLAQLVKLLALATFFPASDGEGFNVVPDLLKSSADVIDVVGMYLMITYFMTGKSEVRYFSTGLGWAAAFSASSRVFIFWSGARGTAFHWRYMQSALESSSDLILYTAMACLVGIASRTDLPAGAKRFATALLAASVFHGFIYQCFFHYLALTSWSLVAAKFAFSLGLGGGAVMVYSTLNYHAQYYNKRD